jgi:biotin transport system substrate-specific component
VPETLAFVWLRRAGVRPSAVLQALLVLLGGVAVAGFARISFALPFTSIPITGQNLGVLLVGSLLGAWRGAAALGVYLLLGAAGAPVFADGGSGLEVLGGQRGGYLAGFVAAAAVVGAFAERAWDRNFALAMIATLVGQTLILFVGGLWLARYIGLVGAIEQGVVPFLLGAWVKSVLAAALLSLAWWLTGDS